MPAALIEALERLAKLRGYESPRLILARQPEKADRRPWWAK